MEVVAAFLGGVLVGAVLWKLMAPGFAAAVFTRQNFRDRDLPTAVGVILALALLVGAALIVLWATIDEDVNGRLLEGMLAATVVAVGFAFLGLLDDLGGIGQSGGFRGHLKALAHGELTTGAVKLFGGAAVGLVAVFVLRGTEGQWWWLLTEGALIALSANLGNLFDRAPGRVTKLSLVAFVVLLIAVGLDESLVGVALAVGAATGLLWPDLREKLMLGDAGANVLGGVLGLGVVIGFHGAGSLVVMVVVAALNVASEKVSFSRVINQVAPLRAFDRLGREPVG